MVRHETVPDSWKHPFGPYRQAPEEFGGEWWLVSPFHGEKPWERFQTPINEPDYPEGFIEIFGPKPNDRIKRVEWEQELKYFKQAGFPEWAPEDAWGDANTTFEYWGMGAPMHYEGRYGWRTRFPGSVLPDFDPDTRSCLVGTHLVVAHYQVRLAQEGYDVAERHPFVPPHLWGDEEGE